MPPAGDGFYYFSTYFYVVQEEFALFEIQINRETLCSAQAVHATIDNGPVVCGGASYIMEGS